MKNKSVLILGSKSDVGIALANKFAREGFSIQLAARKIFELEDYCEKIKKTFGVEVKLIEFDVLNFDENLKIIFESQNTPEIVICTVGFLGNQDVAMKDIDKTKKIIRTNFEGPVTIINYFANSFANRGYGTIIGISSVAGDRGRSSNFLYGSAKAGFSAYLSGLRNRLYPKNVNVISVLPGYIDTKMTIHLSKDCLM